MQILYRLVLLTLLSGASLFASQVPTIAHADTIASPRPQITVSTVRASRIRHTPPPPVTTPPFSPPPATTPPAPANPPAQTLTYAEQLEKEIFDRINAQRVQNGLTKLAQDDKLTDLARAHSTDMITNNYFSHTDLSGCDLVCRFQVAVYAYRSIGENIYWMSGYTLTPAAAADMVVNGWMNSPGHRANILNGAFTNQGIGVAVKGTIIDVTQDLALPR